MYTSGDPHLSGSMIVGLINLVKRASRPGHGAKRSSKRSILARLLLTIFMLLLPFILIILVIVWATASTD